MAVALMCVAVGSGCPGKSDQDSRPRQDTTRVETAEPLPPLPRGWRRTINARAGLSVGVPPAWTASEANGTTLVRSDDRALAIAIAADRSSDGRRLSPTEYLRRTVRALPGYRHLRLGAPRPLRNARYSAARVTATGTFAGTGVRQAVVIYALQRPPRVTYVLSAFRDARVRASRYDTTLRDMLRTFAALPPAGQRTPGAPQRSGRSG